MTGPLGPRWLTDPRECDALLRDLSRSFVPTVSDLLDSVMDDEAWLNAPAGPSPWYFANRARTPRAGAHRARSAR